MLPLRIAWRYLIAKKSHSAVNIISIVSLAGVAVATAAIVVVLSVFNGFTSLAERQLSRLDPDLMVSRVDGRPFAGADSLAARIAALPGVDLAMPSLTDRGLIVADGRQLPVVFKGVTPDYNQLVEIDSVAIDGAFLCGSDPYGRAMSQLAVGVAAQLSGGPATLNPELYVPRRVGRINPANPATALSSIPLRVSGVLQLDQMDFDADHIIIPLDRARELLAYDFAEATAIEVALEPGGTARHLIRDISEIAGPGFDVLTRPEQHRETFRMISLEKWVTFIMLAFILLIAAFNIISTLSLMVIEKRDNMLTLRALGAGRGFVRSIFMWQGAIITLAGGLAGCVLGLALALAQQYGRFIKLNGDPSKLTIDVYPVHVEAMDILAVMGIIAVVAALASQTTRLFTRRIT